MPLRHLHGCCNLFAHKANKSQQSCLITKGIDHHSWRQPENLAIGNDAVLLMESISLEEMPTTTVPSLHQDFVFQLCLSSQLNQCLHSCRNLICKSLNKADGNNRASSCSFSILLNSCFIKTSLHVLCLHGCWNPSQILLRWIPTLVPRSSASSHRREQLNLVADTQLPTSDLIGIRSKALLDQTETAHHIVCKACLDPPTCTPRLLKKIYQNQMQTLPKILNTQSLDVHCISNASPSTPNNMRLRPRSCRNLR